MNDLVPDPGGWVRNLAFVWIGVFVGLLGAQFVFPFIPFYIQELGVEDRSQVAYFTGFTASATGLSLTLTAPLWGVLADRYGRKPMFIRALVGAAAVVVLMGFAQNVWQLVALRFVMGAFAGTMGAASALVAASTPRARLGYALGWLQTGQFMANSIGPVFGGVVSAAVGLRGAFFITGSLYAVAAALVLLFVREARREPPQAGRPAPREGIVASLRDVTRHRQVLVMLALLFSLWLSTSYVRPVLPLSIDVFASAGGVRDDTVGIRLPGLSADLRETAATGVVFGLIGLTSTLAAVSLGPLGARFGYRNCVAAAAAATGLLYIPASFASGYTSFLLLLGFAGLFQGAMVPGTSSLIAASAPEGRQGSAFGLAASMQSLALLVGPLGGGLTSGVLGVEAVYAIIGVVLLGAAVFALAFVREPARPGP